MFKVELRKLRVSVKFEFRDMKAKKQIQVNSFRLQFGDLRLYKE